MILYFSGTGNSAYVAKRTGKETGDEVVDLFSKIRNQDFSELYTTRPLVVVVPTYAWRIPRIVHRWIENTSFAGNRNIYFILTCAGDIGNAGRYLSKLCQKKNLNYQGCMGIVMPENYIALFSSPSPDEAMRIIDQAEPSIDQAIRHIKDGTPFSPAETSFKGVINSGIVNDLFYPLFVHSGKFRATDKCISCKTCVNVCPLNNIRLDHGKPVWNRNCTHCMACICRCPVEAIEYGRHSEGLPRYVCRKNV